MGTCQGSRQCQSLEVISRTGKDNPKLLRIYNTGKMFEFQEKSIDSLEIWRLSM